MDPTGLVKFTFTEDGSTDEFATRGPVLIKVGTPAHDALGGGSLVLEFKDADGEFIALDDATYTVALEAFVSLPVGSNIVLRFSLTGSSGADLEVYVLCSANRQG